MLLRMLLVFLTTVPIMAVDDHQRAWKYSVQGDKLHAISRLMYEVEDVNLPTHQGKTALMAAANRGDAALVRALLDLGADANAVNRAGGTALMYAAWSGDLGSVQLLLDNGAEINRQAIDGWSALMMAAAQGHDHAVRLLLERGADVNASDNHAWTSLMRAVYRGYEETVKVLAHHSGVNIGLANDRGQTALHLAVIEGHSAIVQDLLARGASPDIEDAMGLSPRDIAHAMGRETLLALLH